MRRRASLRTRFLVLVVVGAVLPLALIGLWLTRTAARSGEALLTDRLDALLASSAQEIRSNWPRVRGDLLTLAESDAARAVLGAFEGATTSPAGDRPGESEADSRVRGRTNALPDVPPGLGAVIRSLALLDTDDNGVWTSEPDPTSLSARPGLVVRLPVFRAGSSEPIGALEAELAFDALLDEGTRTASPLGSVLAATDPATGASLLPLPFDVGLLSEDRFDWGGDDWIVRRSGLADPSVWLAAAAPVTPLVAPFDRAAQQGLLILFVVASLSVGIAIVLTGILTRSLGRLTAAADAVARGELEHTLDATGDDEIGRVARAFNLMTANLRQTLRQLADRQALAAVGEFAASLSHEIRNALTSIRLDMQVAGEHLPPDPDVREPHERALQEIGRLEETVAGALRLARSGKTERRTLDLRQPLEAAAHAARPEFAKRGARLITQVGPGPMLVAGDPAGLEQMFLNLLLNAAQSLEPGQRAFLAADPGPGGKADRGVQDGAGDPDRAAGEPDGEVDAPGQEAGENTGGAANASVQEVGGPVGEAVVSGQQSGDPGRAAGDPGREPGDSSTVTVSIRDEGPGIPPESRDRVFEPFYSTRAEGTGLGLPIARRIVQAHGGRMRIESEQGRGCTVVIMLPRWPKGSPPRATP